MRSLLTLLTLLSLATEAQSQTFLDGLRNSVGPSGAVVTVTQQKDIDDLVNGRQPAAYRAATTANDSLSTAAKTAPAAATPRSASSPDDDDSATTYEVVPDTTPKVMRNARKVNGYRVQVYVGGNTRQDKSRAYNAGSVMKSYFPDQPVYVHFYSPRWKCLMGNFRTYAEAAALVPQVRDAGYRQACVVKGKITVTD